MPTSTEHTLPRAPIAQKMAKKSQRLTFGREMRENIVFCRTWCVTVTLLFFVSLSAAVAKAEALQAPAAPWAARGHNKPELDQGHQNSECTGSDIIEHHTTVSLFFFFFLALSGALPCRHL